MKIKKLQCNFAKNLYYYRGKQKDFIDMLKRKFPEIEEEFIYASDVCGQLQTVIEKDKPYYYIWTEKREIPVISHEVLHAVFKIAIHLEINFTDEEFYTNLQQDLVEQILIN